MNLQLTGKIAIVTGASRGIGLAIAQALSREGVSVVGTARTITSEMKRACETTVSADLSTPEGGRSVIDVATATYGGIDILINNVGAGDTKHLKLGSFLEANDEQWRNLLDLNLFSAVWASRAALPSLITRRGVIINIASINARIPAPGPVGYSEAKAALVAFSKRLSEEFGPCGVRVNTVSPGPVGTGLWRDESGFGANVASAYGVTHEDFLVSMPTTFGMTSGHIVEPEEVAELITFLASPITPNLIGTDIVIDGGIVKTS